MWDHPEVCQTFKTFSSNLMKKVTPYNKTILITPLQNMDEIFLQNLCSYCKAFFFGMEVKIYKSISLDKLKISSRINEYTNQIQYNANEILKQVSMYFYIV